MKPPNAAGLYGVRRLDAALLRRGSTRQRGVAPSATPSSLFGVARFLDSYSASYGSLGAVMILLVWLYITALAFLIGGTINAEIDRAIARHCNPITA